MSWTLTRSSRCSRRQNNSSSGLPGWQILSDKPYSSRPRLIPIHSGEDQYKRLATNRLCGFDSFRKLLVLLQDPRWGLVQSLYDSFDLLSRGRYNDYPLAFSVFYKLGTLQGFHKSLPQEPDPLWRCPGRNCKRPKQGPRARNKFGQFTLLFTELEIL